MIGDDGKMANERTVSALLYHIAGYDLSYIKVIKE